MLSTVLEYRSYHYSEQEWRNNLFWLTSEFLPNYLSRLLSSGLHLPCSALFGLSYPRQAC